MIVIEHCYMHCYWAMHYKHPEAIPGWASPINTRKAGVRRQKTEKKKKTRPWLIQTKKLPPTPTCMHWVPEAFYKLQTPWRNTFHFVNILPLSWSSSCNKSKYTLPEILSENGPIGAGKFHHKPQMKVLLNGNKHSSTCSPSSRHQYRNSNTCNIPAMQREQHMYLKELLCMVNTVITKSNISTVTGSKGKKSGYQMSKAQH